MKSLLVVCVAVLMSFMAYAQPTQTVRGQVVDSESQFPLIGVAVIVVDQSGVQKTATTDVEGVFRVDNVLVGRAVVTCSYLGYQDFVLPDLIVNSGKENILEVKMSEAFEEIAEVEIVARKAGETVNDMAIVSAREFSVQETDRYAGSRGEPARMASNFAGVQGADDSRKRHHY